MRSPLTAAQRHDAVSRYWRDIILDCRSIDQHRARAAVKQLYREFRRREPDAVLIFRSPQEATIAMWMSMRPQARSKGLVPTSRLIDHPVGASPIEPSSVGDDVQRLFDSCLGGPVRRMLGRTNWAYVSTQVLREAVGSLRRQALKLDSEKRHRLIREKPLSAARDLRLVHHVQLGFWMGWLAGKSIATAECKSSRSDSAFREALTRVCRECGWCQLYEDLAIVCDRPRVLKVDTRGRLHARDGVALEFSDGFGIHALHGVQVAASVIGNPTSITPERIAREANVEVRRVLLDMLGHERFLQAARGEVVARDATGTLWRAHPAVRGEHWMLVEVVNGTAEPDGTYRRYYLRVPPGMRSAREAVAWTYGLAEEDYVPACRT